MRGDPRSRADMARLIDVSRYKAAFVVCGECAGEGQGWGSRGHMDSGAISIFQQQGREFVVRIPFLLTLPCPSLPLPSRLTLGGLPVDGRCVPCLLATRLLPNCCSSVLSCVVLIVADWFLMPTFHALPVFRWRAGPSDPQPGTLVL